MADEWIVFRPTEDHWLELRDPDGWWHADVRFDGCIHLYRAYNSPLKEDETTDQRPTDDPHYELDYLHICDLDETIERLKALKAKILIERPHFEV